MNNAQIIFLSLSIFKKIKLKMLDKMNEIQQEGENLTLNENDIVNKILEFINKLNVHV